MRLPIIAVLLLISVMSYSQKRLTEKNPFQIFDCSETYGKKGTPYKRFDFLDKNDALTISKNGKCLLIHYTGTTLEFAGDTTVSIADLMAQLNFNFRNTGPDITFLFATEHTEVACHDCYSAIIFPSGSRVFYGPDQNLCLKWNNEGHKKCTVKITNIFDDSLATFHTEENEIRITLSDILKDEGSLASDQILVSLNCENKVWATAQILMAWKSSIQNPFQCKIIKPTDAVMIGYFLETNQKINEAEEYYRTATMLSSDEVFREILTNYKKRHEGHRH